MRDFLLFNYKSSFSFSKKQTRGHDDSDDSEDSDNDHKAARLEENESDTGDVEMDLDIESLSLLSQNQQRHKKVMFNTMRELSKTFPKSTIYRHNTMSILVVKKYNDEINDYEYRVFQIIPGGDEFEELHSINYIDEEQYVVMYKPPIESTAGPSNLSSGLSNSDTTCRKLFDYHGD